MTFSKLATHLAKKAKFGHNNEVWSTVMERDTFTLHGEDIEVS